MSSYQVRTAHGTIHAMTEGEYGRPQISLRDGSTYRGSNRADKAAGKANCGTLTSTAAKLTSEPVNCPKCLAR